MSLVILGIVLIIVAGILSIAGVPFAGYLALGGLLLLLAGVVVLLLGARGPRLR